MSLEYRAYVAERGVEVAFEVADGETVALLGPNGAGKSTALSVTAGLLRPNRGQVVLDGRVLSSRKSSLGAGRDVHVAPHDRQVALLAQEPLLFPHLSALDNVAFGPRSAGVSRRAAREQAEHWLEEVGLADLSSRRPSQLSGGQAQRVAIARALAADPKLLLLDEPLSALDVAVTPALRQTLRKVLADRSVVLVTHDVLDALLLADRVIVLENGAVVEEGLCAEVLARPRSAFAAQIAGLNMIRGTWRDGVVHSPADLRIEGTISGPVPEQGADVAAVFPPSAVSVFLQAPGGSPRNAFEVTIAEIEPHSSQIRLRANDLTADVTAHAVAALDLVPGTQAVFVVKATEVAVYST